MAAEQIIECKISCFVWNMNEFDPRHGIQHRTGQMAWRADAAGAEFDCRGFLELSGSVAHELSAFSAVCGKRRRA